MRSAVVSKRRFHGFGVVAIAVGLSATFFMPLFSASAQGVLRPTTTQLSATPLGHGASFEVKVGGTAGVVPTGTVSLWSGETPIAAAVLDANGVATYTADQLPPNTRQVTASYSGDAHFSPSNSMLTPVAAASTGVPSFTLAANPPTLTVKAGTYATTVISVIPANGFDQTVNLSCSGLPIEATCTFAPVNVLLGTNGATAISTLNIQTQAASGTAVGALGHTGSPLLALILPGSALLAGLGLLRKRSRMALRMLGITVLLLGASLGLSSCAPRYNYFHKPPSGNPGTTLGTSTIVISGEGVANTGTLVTATTQLTLTVN
jgi:Bacterial Ig-like domain (group 3)